MLVLVLVLLLLQSSPVQSRGKAPPVRPSSIATDPSSLPPKIIHNRDRQGKSPTHTQEKQGHFWRHAGCDRYLSTHIDGCQPPSREPAQQPCRPLFVCVRSTYTTQEAQASGPTPSTLFTVFNWPPRIPKLGKERNSPTLPSSRPICSFARSGHFLIHPTIRHSAGGSSVPLPKSPFSHQQGS